MSRACVRLYTKACLDLFYQMQTPEPLKTCISTNKNSERLHMFSVMFDQQI